MVDGDLVLLELKYRALPQLELLEICLIGMCLVDRYDEMVRDLGGINYENRLTTNDSSPSSLASEGFTTAINNIICVSANFQKQLDMLSPYQSDA